jgi:hypothetical protein
MCLVQALLPAPIAPLVGFVLGVAFVWAASDDLLPSDSPRPASRSVLVVALFSLLVFAPICAYFLAFTPDWSYGYLIDSERVPTAASLALVLLDVASVPAGFLVAASYARGRSTGPLLRIAGLPLLLAALFVAATLKRLSLDATYAQYQGDFGTRSVAGTPLGYALVWMTAVLVLASGWTLHLLRRIGRSR